MKLKEILRLRLDALQALTQSGKRLSKATLDKINGAIATLTELMGADEPGEAAAEQAWTPVGEMLYQAMLTGESVADSYEKQRDNLREALRKAKPIEGARWYYLVYTWPDRVVFWADFDQNGGDYPYKTYRADYTVSEGTYTFSNVQEWAIVEIGVAVQSAIEKYDAPLLQADERTYVPTDATLTMLEQSDGAPPVWFQTFSGVHIVQDKSSPGKTVIAGIATQGNVVNSYGAVFPTALWQSEAPRMQQLIQEGRAYGTLGHPYDDKGKPRSPQPQELSHKFTSLNQDGDMFKFEAEVLQTSAGKELQALLDGGVQLDMSTAAAGKLKKQKWNGQSAYVAQSEGFTWLRIADVVLNGASPGSVITDVRLQSLDAEPEEEMAPMDPEQIKLLIQEAVKSGNTELTARLQALEEKGLEQKVVELSEADKALLQSAQAIVDAEKARTVKAARDAKVDEVLDKMVQDKELPDIFKAGAKTVFQSVAATAEDVEGKKAEVLAVLAPAIAVQSTYQSKGYYMKEHNDDGTKKAKVQTGAEAIEDLIQSRIETGKLPKDTGIEEPSNIVHNTRVILQTMATEHPELLKGYMMLRNGDMKSLEQCVDLLHQSYGDLMQTGEFTTADIASAIPYLMPIVTEMTPQLIASRYCSLQPMSRSQGTIAYWKIKDENGNNIKEVANFTGSYANDPGELQAVKYLQGNLTTQTITPSAKKLGYGLSIELVRRLRSDWGMDASGIMVTECANEIAREENYNQLAEIVAGATGGNWNYGTAKPTDNSFDGEQWQKQIITYLMFARSGLRKKTFSNTVAILGESDAIARIMLLAKEVGALSDSPMQGRIARGVNINGSLTTGEDLVSVDWWESLGVENKLLLVARGDEWYRSGYVVAPYGGLYVTPQWVNPSTLKVEQGMLHEVATKMVDGNYFGTITIQEGTAGVPL